eukprot:Nitzschia sp. Nitz4//scaffold130_size63480//6421//7002//NITZ4_006238-RA/size63480-processed-gene-0.74-mRNA-1//1//CDS//3329535156//5819//frame0
MLWLLVCGAVWELVVRGWLMTLKKKPASIRKREAQWKQLERQVKKSRDLGPQAFVETAKLERQHLSEGKELESLAEQRKASVAQWEGRFRSMNMAIYTLIFVVFYGVPVMELTADRIAPLGGELLTLEQAQTLATKSMQGFLFPLSYVGFALRIAKFGLPSPQTSIGALLVFWSSQTTVNMIADGVEALYMSQ